METQRTLRSLRRRNLQSTTMEPKNLPFTDLSNFNLTPTDALRKLCCSTTVSGKPSAASAGFRSTIPKSPISVSGSGSKSSKPYPDNSTDAKSETSVGSSSFVQVQNPKVLGKSAPVRAPASFQPSPTTSASGDGEPAVYGQKVIARKSGWEKEATVIPCSSTLLQNKKGKGKVVAEPVIHLPTGSNKEKEKVTGKSFSRLRPEDKKDQNELVAKHVSSLLSDFNKDKGKQVVDTVSHLPANNKKDRWKGISESLRSPPPKNNNDKGHASLSDSNSRANKNKGKDTVEHISHLSTERGKNKEKEISESLSSTPSKTKKDRGNVNVNIASSCEKTIATSDVSLKSSPSRTIRGKRKSDKVALSCPPLPKKRNTRTKVNEGDAELSGSWSDPNAMCAKKRRPRKKPEPKKPELPAEFVKQQRDYFKEIDEFELPEEEASDSD